jgi:uncharacterized protein (DUF2141 family)
MPLIKTSALLSTLLLGAAPLASAAVEAPSQAARGGASLVLAFEGVKTPRGRILAAVHEGEAAYAGRGAPAQTRPVALTVEGGRATTTLTGLKPGRYAVRAFHDLDGDGKMSTNPFGVPTEPFAFSNNAKGVMGPASWADASFDVGPGGAAQTIVIE